MRHTVKLPPHGRLPCRQVQKAKQATPVKSPVKEKEKVKGKEKVKEKRASKEKVKEKRAKKQKSEKPEEYEYETHS